MYMLKGYCVPAGVETGERSVGCVAVKADLYRDGSIVCLYVCSALCQAGTETEA